MCMKYETQYNNKCFDYMFFDVNPKENIMNFLKEHWSIKIIDEEKFRVGLFTLLEMCHEEIIIEPIPMEGAEEWKI